MQRGIVSTARLTAIVLVDPRWSELQKSALRQTHRRDRNATKHTHKLQLAEMVEIGVHARRCLSHSSACSRTKSITCT